MYINVYIKILLFLNYLVGKLTFNIYICKIKDIIITINKFELYE